ncbi:Cox family DNA-binding protein [Aeromonas enteropelogenes]|uniref:Cox family DNA-binding protein n=1 Tax=Aeromonas enteropelogenes TaxID=29489 RepID=UPI003B9DDF8F
MRAEASSQAPVAPVPPVKLVCRASVFRPELSPPPGYITTELFGQMHGWSNDAVEQACRDDGKFPYIEMRNPLNPTAKAKRFINMNRWNQLLERAYLNLPKARRNGCLAWMGFDPKNLPDVILLRQQFEGRRPWSDALSRQGFAESVGFSKSAVDKMCEHRKLPYVELKIPELGVRAVKLIYMPAWNGALAMAYEIQSAARGEPFEAWFGIQA